MGGEGGEVCCRQRKAHMRRQEVRNKEAMVHCRQYFITVSLRAAHGNGGGDVAKKHKGVLCNEL